MCRLQNSNGLLPNRDKIRKILTIHLHKYVKLHLTLQKAYKKDNVLPLYSIILYQNSMQKIQALFNILALSLVFNFSFEKSNPDAVGLIPPKNHKTHIYVIFCSLLYCVFMFLVYKCKLIWQCDFVHIMLHYFNEYPCYLFKTKTKKILDLDKETIGNVFHPI